MALAGPAGAGRRRGRRVRARGSRRRRAARRAELLRRRPRRARLRRAVDPGPRRRSSATTSTWRSASASSSASRRSTRSTATGSTGVDRRGAGRARPRRTSAVAADAAARIGATVLVEPVSGPKPYPLRTAADAVAVVDAVRAAGHANVGFLCDLFHLANNGDDVDAAIARARRLTAHVQIADCPGRGEPGTGELDLDRLLGDLAEPRATPAGSAWSTSRPPTPRPAWPGCRASDAPRPRDLTERSTQHDHDRLHRSRDHGQPDGGPPAEGRIRRLRLQPAARATRPLVDVGGRAATSIAEAVKGADVVAVMVPDSPDVQEVRSPARAACSSPTRSCLRSSRPRG